MSGSDTSPILLADSQVAQGAELFARVFQNAPDMQYFIGENAVAESKILQYYQAIIRIGLLHGEVYTTSAMDGVAVWVSPENSQLSFGILIRTGFLKALVSMGARPLARFVRSARYLEKLQKQAISEPCWILVQIGVESARQGKGIGGLLIQPILTRAAAEGVSCYVESADERNLSFYTRHGFEIVNHGQVSRGGPPVWVMIRKPNSP